jgi:hypothetical protein
LFSKVLNLLKSFRCNFRTEFKINECAKNSEILDLSLFLNVLSRKSIKIFWQSVYCGIFAMYFLHFSLYLRMSVEL